MSNFVKIDNSASAIQGYLAKNGEVHNNSKARTSFNEIKDKIAFYEHINDSSYDSYAEWIEGTLYTFNNDKRMYLSLSTFDNNNLDKEEWIRNNIRIFTTEEFFNEVFALKENGLIKAEGVYEILNGKLTASVPIFNKNGESIRKEGVSDTNPYAGIYLLTVQREEYKFAYEVLLFQEVQPTAEYFKTVYQSILEICEGDNLFYVRNIETNYSESRKPEWNWFFQAPRNFDESIGTQALSLKTGKELLKAIQEIPVTTSVNRGTILDKSQNNDTAGYGSVAMGIESVAGVLGYYFTNVDLSKQQLTLSKEQGIPPTESFDIKYKIGDVISMKYDREYLACSTIIAIDKNVITLDILPFSKLYEKDSPAINDFALYDVNNPLAGEVPITESSFAGGKGCKAMGALSLAFGHKNVAYGYNATAFGGNTSSEGWLTFTEGYGTTARGDYAHAEGGDTVALGQGSHSEGRMTRAYGNSAHTEGKETESDGLASHSEGHRTHTLSEAGHAEGMDTMSVGIAAHAGGNGTTAEGNASHTTGFNTWAVGQGSFAAGNYSVAGDDYSFAMGDCVEAYGRAQFAVGRYNEFDDEQMFIVGIGVSDSFRKNGFTVDRQGNGHFAGDVTVGKDNNKLVTTKELNEKQTEIEKKIPAEKGTGTNSIIQKGASNTASGTNASALGGYNAASGDYSFTSGQSNKATGRYSHVEGYQCEASNNCGHAEGENTKSLGYFTHTEGRGTIARSTASHAQGKYNIDDTENKYAHIVGNGKSDTERSNAHTLDWNGNAWFAESVEAPTIYTNQVVLLSPNNKKFALKVNDDGTLYTEEVSE